MSARVLIVWPDSALAGALGTCLVAARPPFDVETLASYPPARELDGLIQGHSPPLGVVIIGFTGRPESIELLRHIRSHHPDLLLVAAGEAGSADAVLAAMRAGASEYLSPPFDVGHLWESVRRRKLLHPAAADKRGRLICFMPACGGCGASMIALHVAMAVAAGSEKQRLLVVDLDFHCGALAFRLGLRPEFTLADALVRAYILDELWQRLATERSGFELLPAPPFRSLPTEALQNLPRLFESAQRIYSGVIVDLPPGMFPVSERVLQLADQVYLVTTPEVVPLHLARRRAAELSELGLDRESVSLIVNRVDSLRSLRRDEIEKAVGLPVRSVLRNDYRSVSAADMAGELLDLNTGLGRELRDLGYQIMNVGTGGKPKKSGWRKLLPV